MKPAINRLSVLHAFQDLEVSAQIINTDIDGLLTGALLWEKYRLPIVGFYDTQHLWITPSHLQDGRIPLETTLWVDVDMCWPGSKSLSQHIICLKPSDASDVVAFNSTTNPNISAGITFVEYTPKYPFGTFQWLWWLLEMPPPSPKDHIRSGVVWMPDGGFQSAQGQWGLNCGEWATERLPNSPMAPLFEAGAVNLAPMYVGEAMAELVRLSGSREACWRNMQYLASRRTRNGFEILADPRNSKNCNELTSMLAAIAVIFDWSPASIPSEWEMFAGTWDSKSPQHRTMANWTRAANHREIVSCAFIDRRTFAFTRPQIRGQSGASPSGHIADVLP